MTGPFTLISFYQLGETKHGVVHMAEASRRCPCFCLPPVTLERKTRKKDVVAACVKMTDRPQWCEMWMSSLCLNAAHSSSHAPHSNPTTPHLTPPHPLPACSVVFETLRPADGDNRIHVKLHCSGLLALIHRERLWECGLLRSVLFLSTQRHSCSARSRNQRCTTYSPFRHFFLFFTAS